MSDTAQTRKEAKERTRQRLIDSALKLIKERGLSGLTMNQITRKAGIAQPSFYNHYATLYDLLDEVRSQISHTYLEPAKLCFLEQLSLYEREQVSLEEAFQAFFRHVLDALLSDIDIFKAVLADHYDTSGPAGGELGKVMDEINHAWCDFFKILARRYDVHLTPMQLYLYVDSLSALSDQFVLGCHEQRYGKSRAVDAMVHMAVQHVEDIKRRNRLSAV